MQYPTSIWASFCTTEVQNTGYTRHLGPQHVISSNHHLFHFSLAVSPLCIHNIQRVSLTRCFLYIFICVCISHYLTRRISILTTPDNGKFILAFTDILLTTYDVLEWFFKGSENALKNKQVACPFPNQVYIKTAVLLLHVTSNFLELT